MASPPLKKAAKRSPILCADLFEDASKKGFFKESRSERKDIHSGIYATQTFEFSTDKQTNVAQTPWGVCIYPNGSQKGNEVLRRALYAC